MTVIFHDIKRFIAKNAKTKQNRKMPLKNPDWKFDANIFFN